jgi:membrane fusion protein, multidrug efflux system
MRGIFLWVPLALSAFGANADDLDLSAALRPVVSEIVAFSSTSRPDFVGVVAANTQADLGFLVIGTVATRPVEVGDLVAKGALIAQLDPEELDADLRAAEAGVQVAEAQFRATSAAEVRARDLVSRGVDASTSLEDATRLLVAAQARLDQAQASRAGAADIRGYATLTAPQDGVITAIFAAPGATMSAGEPIVTLAGAGALEITVDLTEQDIAGLDVGATFDAKLAAAPEIKAVATLDRIDPVAERATRTRRLHLTLFDPPPGFRLGALVEVSLAATSVASLSLPRTAIMNVDTSPAVWIIDRATNTVARRPITLGAAFGARMRVLAGLAVGDEVVLKGINSLQDGQVVGPRVMP